MYNNNGNNNNDRKGKARGEEVGIVWKLPVLQSKDLGKVGPAFGCGVGCGFGVGIGFLGGAGLGVGVPGLHFGVGIGAGCGVGLGFGYGIGRGWAQDENGKYSNVGRLFKTRGRIEDQIGTMFDDLVSSTRRAIKSIEKEIEKSSR